MARCWVSEWRAAFDIEGEERGQKGKKGDRSGLSLWSGLSLLGVASFRCVGASVWLNQGLTKISALGVEEQRVKVRVDFLDRVPPGRELGDHYRLEARIVTCSVQVGVWSSECGVRGSKESGAVNRGRGGPALHCGLGEPANRGRG